METSVVFPSNLQGVWNPSAPKYTCCCSLYHSKRGLSLIVAGKSALLLALAIYWTQAPDQDNLKLIYVFLLGNGAAIVSVVCGLITENSTLLIPYFGAQAFNGIILMVHTVRVIDDFLIIRNNNLNHDNNRSTTLSTSSPSDFIPLPSTTNNNKPPFSSTLSSSTNSHTKHLSRVNINEAVMDNSGLFGLTILLLIACFSCQIWFFIVSVKCFHYFADKQRARKGGLTAFIVPEVHENCYSIEDSDAEDL